MIRSATRLHLNVTGWLFVLPALALVGIFLVYPVLWSFWMSFQVGKGASFSFGGLKNFIRLAQDPVFLLALSNTMLFLLIQVPLMLLVALVLAVILNDSSFRGRSFFRAALFLPCVTSLVTYSVLFKSMFATDGVINDLLLALHVIGEPITWLASPFWAKIVIIVAITWRWTGYNMIFYLAALQNTDRSIYEAARIDGVPAWAQFIFITIPLLKPVILFTSVISTIGTLQLFDEVYNITEGGPADSTLTLSLYIYNLTFRFMPNYGYAAAVSYVIVAMVAFLSLVQFMAARDRKAV